MSDFLKQKTKILVANKKTNYLLLSFIFVTALFYVYFANTTVHTLSTLEKTKQHIQSLNIEVSELESKHLVVENSFSTEKALNLGFVEISNPIFIMKNSGKATLSLKID